MATYQQFPRTKTPDTGSQYFGWAEPGLGDVGAYRVSGQPWMTGSADLGGGQEHVHRFPAVTREITVINHGAKDLRVHFVSTSSDGQVISKRHFITVSGSTLADTDSMFKFECKANAIFLTNPGANAAAGKTSYEIFAQLTPIPAAQMYHLTGSGLTD